jgi:protein-disulfide isomerase
VLGSPNAPVTIVWYGDYKCPFCTTWAVQTEPQLQRAFIDTDKVWLVWHDFVNIDAESGPAAEAARCAGAQGRFWADHNALYHYTWNTCYARNSSAEGEAAFTGHYEQLARQAGVRNIAAFSACRTAGAYRGAVDRSRGDGVSRGIQGTPTFFIEGQKVVGPPALSVFRRLIEAKLGSS